MKKGVMLCGHGSRDPDALTEFQALATGLRASLGLELAGLLVGDRCCR